jgi:NAD(P)-dependent dehydrogenase (short-subunit alcohol dehydrogenase family)
MHDPVTLFSLKGRTAMVTGASSGIGLASARALAGAGAKVVLVARASDRLEAATQGILADGGQAIGLACDLSDIDALANLQQALATADLSPDILVNNAGGIDRAPFSDVEPDEWDRIMALNLTAPLRLAQFLIEDMRRRRWGRIVNVASILAVHGKPNAHSYTASKHAIAGLTKSMAAELGRDGVCVNALCPGYIKTEINQTLQNDAAFTDRLLARVPLGRWGEPSDLIGPLLLLCSDASNFINGHLMVVDGGLTATH